MRGSAVILDHDWALNLILCDSTYYGALFPFQLVLTACTCSRIYDRLQWRLVLKSLRPWSFPASMVPICLAGVLVDHVHQGQYLLYSIRFLLVFLVVIPLHAAANLVNTYYDFAHGVDVKVSHSSCRLVTPSQK